MGKNFGGKKFREKGMPHVWVNNRQAEASRGDGLLQRKVSKEQH